MKHDGKRGIRRAKNTASPPPSAPAIVNQSVHEIKVASRDRAFPWIALSAGLRAFLSLWQYPAASGMPGRGEVTLVQ
jgi:hypothetical protein